MYYYPSTWASSPNHTEMSGRKWPLQLSADSCPDPEMLFMWSGPWETESFSCTFSLQLRAYLSTCPILQHLTAFQADKNQRSFLVLTSNKKPFAEH